MQRGPIPNRVPRSRRVSHGRSAGHSRQNGRGWLFRIGLPAATYTIKAHGRTASDVPLFGEATGVVVTVGHTVIVDITVTERECPPP